MTDEEFNSLLEALGGEMSRWPVNQLEAAEALLEHSATARRSLKAMQEVERLLAIPVSSRALNGAAIAAHATQHRQASPAILSPSLRKASFAALGALALAGGILTGMTPAGDTAIIGSVQMALNGGGSDVW